jgi:hypothetical protein
LEKAELPGYKGIRETQPLLVYSCLEKILKKILAYLETI